MHSGRDLLAPAHDDGNITVYHADFRDVLPHLEPGTVDLVLTDPPYLKRLEHLYAEFAQLAVPLLRDGGSLVTLLGHHQMPEVIHALDQSGLRFWWVAGMRHTTYRRLPGKWVTAMWKPALWYVKGTRRADHRRTPFDMLAGERRDKRYHEWGQPVDWFAHWVANLTDPGECVLDPFAGAGTTLVAARDSGRRAIGVELDADHCATTVARVTGTLTSGDSEQQVLFDRHTAGTDDTPLEVAS